MIYLRVQKESDELSYTVWSLVTVRNQLPVQVVNIRHKTLILVCSIPISQVLQMQIIKTQVSINEVWKRFTTRINFFRDNCSNVLAVPRKIPHKTDAIRPKIDGKRENRRNRIGSNRIESAGRRRVANNSRFIPQVRASGGFRWTRNNKNVGPVGKSPIRNLNMSRWVSTVARGVSDFQPI